MHFLVVLQPFNFNASDKHKHKFMVQFMIEPEGCSMTADDLVCLLLLLLLLFTYFLLYCTNYVMCFSGNRLHRIK